jgi:hypothetical protein
MYTQYVLTRKDPAEYIGILAVNVPVYILAQWLLFRPGHRVFFDK